MTKLDILIYTLASIGLLISCFRRQAFIAAAVVCASFLFNEIKFNKYPTASQFESWLFALAIKDYLSAVIISFAVRIEYLIIMLLFMTSCAFHLLIQVWFDHDSLALFYYRPQFMVYITAAQLATMYLIILTGSGSNGGKRVKYNLPGFNRHYDRFFYTKAFKVKQ